MKKRLYLFSLLLFAFAFSATAQWTATGGPYGGNITSIKKAPNGNLYAVVNQKLWKSTNNGDLWTAVAQSTLYLNDIMIDSDGKLYAAYWSQLFSSSDNGATWTTIASNLFDNAQSIDHVGPDNVFVVWGYSGVYVSIDKGVTWTQISTLSPQGTPALVSNSAGDIFYASQPTTNVFQVWKHPYKGLTSNWTSGNMVQTPYSIATTDYLYSMTIDKGDNLYVLSYSNLFKSTNAGTSFTSIKASLAPSTYFYGMMGTDASVSGTNVYFFSGSDAKIYKSANQGGSWTSSTLPTSTFGGSITYPPIFASASTYFLGTSSGVLKTADTGATWATKNTGLTGATTNQIVVANTTGKIIAAEYAQGYINSIDGGNTWNLTALPNSGYASKVLKLANNNIILYGNGNIFRSTDNATTFVSDNIYRSDNAIIEATNGDLYLFYGVYVNPNWVSHIAKSTDSGATWTDLTVTGLPTSFNMYVSAIDGGTTTPNMMMHGYDPNAGVNKTFKLAVTATTATATLLTLPYTYGLNNLFFQNGKFYASQYSAFYSTTDLGTTWTATGFSGNYVFPVKNTSYSGIAVSRAGSLYISQDNGGTWNNTTLPSTSAYITNIAADASGNYYASANSSAVLKLTSAIPLLVDPATLPPYINFNWQPLNGPYGGNAAKIQIHPDGTTLFAISQGYLWKNGSGSYAKVDPSGVNYGFKDVEVDKVTGDVYALSNSNPQKIYKSTNKGTTWTPLAATGLPTANGIFRITKLNDGVSNVALLAFGYDAGATFGNIYKSTDDGATFTSKFTSTLNIAYANGLGRIPAVSPTGAVAVFSAASEGMVVSTDFGSTWTVKSTSTVMDPVNGFSGSFMYDKDGNLLMHVIVDTTIPLWHTDIVKSTNNGTTWTFLNTPTAQTPDGTSNYSKRIAVLGTGEYLMCIQSRFDCYRSADGGTTWNNIGNVGDVFVWAATQGTTSYVLGNGTAGILKTTDGGLTFTSASTGMPHPQATAINLSNNRDLVIGATRPFYSSDFGQTLTLATLEPASQYLQVGDSLIGYGGNRILLKSKDGGKTWAEFGQDLLYFTFLTADAAGTGFYGSDGTNLFHSTNLLTWTQITLSGLSVNGYFISGAVIDTHNVIYAIVQDANTGLNDVYKIIFTGHATKISSAIGTTSPATIAYVNGKIYVYDTNGAIYKSSDGVTWTQGSAPSGNSLVVANNGYLFISSNSSVLWLSRNDGASWQSVGDVPPSSGPIPIFRNVVINQYDGYAYATLSNSVAKKSGNMVMPDDHTPPVITGYSPTISATNVGLKPTITITFDEITKAVAGTNVSIYDPLNPVVPIATIDMATAVQNNKSWSVTVPTALAFNKKYAIIIDEGAVTDIFGNAFVGILDPAVWQFTTKGIPTVSTLSPVNAATNVAVNSPFVVTFSEPVSGLTGKNLSLYKTSAPTTVVTTLDGAVGTSSGNQLTFSFPVGTLLYTTSYFIKFAASEFTSADGGVFTALTANTDWQFTTAAAPDTQAPTITFISDPITQHAGNKIFSPTITDDVGVASAKIFYRSITAPTTTAMDSATLVLNGSTGKYDGTVPEASFGPMGLEFYFKASDAAKNKTISPQTGFYYSYILYQTGTPQIPGGLLGVGGTVADWRIITVPQSLSDSKIGTVFSELGSASDHSKWRMITYKDANSPWSEYPDAFATFTQGKGYFINIKDVPSTGVIIDGATTPANNKASPFIFNLAPGWNEIGNPYTFPMKWSEVLAANNNPAGIATVLKTYNGEYVDNTSDKLDVFEGGFVMNTNSTKVTLTFPLTGSLTGGRIGESVSYNLGEDRWVVPMKLQYEDKENSFGGVGMHPEALVGIDGHDDFNPPHFLDYVEMDFAHPEHFLKRTTRDVVPTQSEYNWEFTVDTNIEGLAQLIWDNSLFGSNSKELYLYDIRNGVLVNMREQNTYSFKPGNSSIFKVYFGEDLKSKIKPEEIGLGQAYPNPSQGNVTIPFTLPENQSQYQVVLEVYNVMGQKVSTLVDGQLNPGFYSYVWDPGQSNSSAGMHIYRLKVSDSKRSESMNGKIIINR